MTVRRLARVMAVLALACPLGAGAQRTDTTCSTLLVRRDSASRDTSKSLSAIDTLITLDIRDRTWQRDAVRVGVAYGATGTAGARRTSWSTCVGVTALLGQVTASLHNVRGQIHFKVDPSALDSIGRITRPPAAPPRR
jgi:hypothetical protein